MTKGLVPVEDMIDFYLDGHPDAVNCQGCNAVFIWDKLPDENIETYREHHGEPNLTPEIVPVAWECPECGHRNPL